MIQNTTHLMLFILLTITQNSEDQLKVSHRPHRTADIGTTSFFINLTELQRS